MCNPQIPLVPLEIDWLILDTDYDSFLSAYACMDFLWPLLPPVKIELGGHSHMTSAEREGVAQILP